MGKYFQEFVKEPIDKNKRDESIEQVTKPVAEPIIKNSTTMKIL